VRRTLVAGWQVVSHSVPVHADIESRPDKADRIAQEFSELLGIQIE
jgi:hypothetical protein